MNKEEIEEIETLEIDFNDTDELELALEVSSKKAIYLIDDLIKYLIELQQENKKYKEVIDKLNNKINSLITCKDKPKEDIIYPHWEICNETKQEMLNILKEVKYE